MEAERGRQGGKLVWRCIRGIQRGKRGLIPLRSANIRDEDGVKCSTTEAQDERWQRPFSKILNVQSEFSLEELGRVRRRPLRADLAELPTAEKLEEGTGKLKSGRAGGESSILPDLYWRRVLEEVVGVGARRVEGEECPK